MTCTATELHLTCFAMMPMLVGSRVQMHPLQSSPHCHHASDGSDVSIFEDPRCMQHMRRQMASHLGAANSPCSSYSGMPCSGDPMAAEPRAAPSGGPIIMPQICTGTTSIISTQPPTRKCRRVVSAALLARVQALDLQRGLLNCECLADVSRVLVFRSAWPLLDDTCTVCS